VEPAERDHSARQHDELAVTRAERDIWLARLRQAEVERDRLRADLADALGQAEYWRTLAEYRERRLVERQEVLDTPSEARLVKR
jgi:hypothetical protein